MEKINVLSLSSGIQCGRVALDKLGIVVDNYYSSEIDKNAIKVTSVNYPEIIQLGDMLKWQTWNIDFSSIDLLFISTPCQSLSVVGNRLGLDDPRGKLFFTAIDIYKHILKLNPNLKVLAENVPTNPYTVDVINKAFGLEARKINSELFSPQTRERLYWTNFDYVSQPKYINSKVLGDILDETGEFYWYDEVEEFYGEDKVVCARVKLNGHDFLKRVNSRYKKCQTLTAVCGGNQHKKVYLDGRVRRLTVNEYEKLMGLPVGYCSSISDSAAYKAIGNGWQVNTVAHILRYLGRWEEL